MMTPEAYKFLGELPSPGPWRLIAWRKTVIAVSPNHAPRMVENGAVVVLEGLPTDLPPSELAFAAGSKSAAKPLQES